MTASQLQPENPTPPVRNVDPGAMTPVLAIRDRRCRRRKRNSSFRRRRRSMSDAPGR